MNSTDGHKFFQWEKDKDGASDEKHGVWILSDGENNELQRIVEMRSDVSQSEIRNAIKTLMFRFHARMTGKFGRQPDADIDSIIKSHLANYPGTTLTNVRSSSRSKLLLKLRGEIIDDMHKLGFSLAQIGRAIGRSRSNISDYLNNRHSVEG